MADYKAMYHKLFNTVTNAEQLVTRAAAMMRAAQQACEETYLESDQPPIKLADRIDDDGTEP